MDQFSLVSIVIITFNSSEYISETLESVKEQTYQNIELVISDDHSSDDTVDICNKWLEENRKLFKNVKIIVPNKNTGTAINLNRGINASTGQWIKILAGDDKLFPFSINEFVNFVAINNCNICCCKLKLFGEDRELIEKEESSYEKCYKEINTDLKCQKKMILRWLFVPGPGLFFSKELFNSVGGYNEDYPFADEWPFTTSIITTGNKIFLVDKELYYYRIHSGSLCRDELGMNERVFHDMRKYFYKEGFYKLVRNGDLFYAWHLYLNYILLTLNYKSNKRVFLKYFKLIMIFSPMTYLNLIKKVIKFINLGIARNPNKTK
ncbi:glycosyltransferase family 2 protein [Treponema primitia]|uniref:glycosyltransferase family 2 protein n=1 Tax=Treponema primitia TaxID=88058 RepID=UPI0002554EC9|nr:glycosyltransferase [Treponema primitia]